MFELLKDLWGFMRERKKLWMAPIIGIMLILGLLVKPLKKQGLYLKVKEYSW